MYPIYVISKGRPDTCWTARFLLADKVPFHLVIEPHERKLYAQYEAQLLILPFSNLGKGSTPARNWVKEHATKTSHKRHWILDDNMTGIKRRYRGRRIPCHPGLALKICGDFVDRYENLAIAGLSYEMFIINGSQVPPFSLNCHCYSCLLVLNSLPHEWRGKYNEDADYCLQVLSDGWCTILFNAFLVWKMRTMGMAGGNTDELYAGDGRLEMARSLERTWPGVVKTKRRYGRPQHVIDWKKFNNKLKRKAEIDLSRMQPDEYGMRLLQVKPDLKSSELRELMESASKKSKVSSSGCG